MLVNEQSFLGTVRIFLVRFWYGCDNFNCAQNRQNKCPNEAIEAHFALTNMNFAMNIQKVNKVVKKKV